MESRERGEAEDREEGVSDPYGNRMKTLGKRNYPSPVSGEMLGSTHSARLEIRQRNPGTPVVAISPRCARRERGSASRSISTKCGAV